MITILESFLKSASRNPTLKPKIRHLDQMSYIKPKASKREKEQNNTR